MLVSFEIKLSGATRHGVGIPSQSDVFLVEPDKLNIKDTNGRNATH